MPVHIVPLVVGGTIAVVGTGYAFKKFVYDPHLAPVIEAFFATRSTEPRQHNEPISIRATARDRLNGARGLLRRKNRGGDRDRAQELEEYQGLLSERDGRRTPISDSTDRQTESQPGTSVSGITDFQMTEQLGPNIPDPGTSTPVQTRSSNDRDRFGPQDAEIRSIIFNDSSPTSRDISRPTSTAPGPASASASAETSGLVLTGAGTTMLVPDIVRPPTESPDHRSTSNIPDPSTTFSFLSLSQISSPEVPIASLDAMSFSQFDTRFRSTGLGRDGDGAESELGFGDDRNARDEVVSLPDTSMSVSGYESGEMVYGTGTSTGISSPRFHPAGGPSNEFRIGNGGLGLNTVGDVGMSYISPPRTSRSVISLSESEGGSDWEALSEARAGSS